MMLFGKKILLALSIFLIGITSGFTQEIFEAVQQGDLDRVKTLLEENP